MATKPIDKKLMKSIIKVFDFYISLNDLDKFVLIRFLQAERKNEKDKNI